MESEFRRVYPGHPGMRAHARYLAPASASLPDAVGPIVESQPVNRHQHRLGSRCGGPVTNLRGRHEQDRRCRSLRRRRARFLKDPGVAPPTADADPALWAVYLLGQDGPRPARHQLLRGVPSALPASVLLDPVPSSGQHKKGGRISLARRLPRSRAVAPRHQL